MGEVSKPRQHPSQAGSASTLARAAFILREARALGIRVGTDGSELVMLVPARVPWATVRWFEHELCNRQHKIVDYILKENAAQEGEFVPDAAGRRA